MLLDLRPVDRIVCDNRTVRRELKSDFRDGLLLGAANLLFGLEPVVEFRAGLIAFSDIAFVGSSPYAFVTRKRLERGSFARAGSGMGITSDDHAITIVCPNGRSSEGKICDLGSL
jgi:hypothetical protein